MQVKLFMSLLSVKVIYDYKTLLSVYWSHQPSIKYISSNIPIPLGNLFSKSQFFPSSILMSPWILSFFLLCLHWRQFCKPCFIVSLWFPHAAFLLVGYFLTSNAHKSSVSSMYSVQFDLILPIVVVGTFPLFDMWFNIV